jgi:hypothetical protein
MQAADADDAEPTELLWKLSLGLYRPQARTADTGHDLNLRWRHDDSSLWLGVYHDAGTGTQTRGGWDTRWQPDADVPIALLPSVQVASGGFVGGSVNVEVGTTWFAQAGLGRTNTKPYVNLNFDPNDAAMGALGWRDDHEGQVMLSVIRDNRLGTGQQDLHLSAQRPLGNGQRLTLDLLHKHGRIDDGSWVRGNGVTATYDWPRWFLRVALDPYQNFSAQAVWRFTAGLRF